MHLALVLSPRARVAWPIVGSAVLLAAFAAGCGHSTPGFSAGPGAPSLSSVADGHYVQAVEMGQGTLLVTPPPDGSQATFSEAKAWSVFQSTDVTEGSYSFAIFGLAIVSLLPGSTPQAPTSSTTLPRSATTSPTNAPPANAPSGGASGSTTTTRAAPATTSTVGPTTRAAPATTTTRAAPATTSTVGPTTTTTAPPPPLPVYERRLAWVGIAFDGPSCPGTTQKSGAASSSTHTEVAVLIDATNGHDILAYTGDAAISCGAQQGTPTVVRPNELVSVPWQPVGPASTAVQATVPACGHYVGWTQAPVPTSQSAVEVVASVPFDPLCADRAPQPTIVDDVVPLGSSQQQQMPHATLGPVQVLHVLPGGEEGAPGSRSP